MHIKYSGAAAAFVFRHQTLKDSGLRRPAERGQKKTGVKCSNSKEDVTIVATINTTANYTPP